MAEAPPKFLRLPAVLDRTGIGRDTLFRLIRRGDFPAQHRISDRASAWLESDVSRWIDERVKASRR
jgi:prophage regulatory protein